MFVISVRFGSQQPPNFRQHPNVNVRAEILFENYSKQYNEKKDINLKEDEFPQITNKEADIIHKAIYEGPQDEVLINKFKIKITRRDLNTLTPDSWLNDNVINFYFNLIANRCDEERNKHFTKVHTMSTFFAERLLQSGYEGVKRWTRKINIFSFDLILIPIHVDQSHWCLATINFKEKALKYYNSMGTPNTRLLEVLADYLRLESLDKQKIPLDTSEFVKENVQDIPQQTNGNDCGVFCCMYAEYISRDHKISFSQKNIPYFRKRIILDILQGKLTSSNDESQLSDNNEPEIILYRSFNLEYDVSYNVTGLFAFQIDSLDDFRKSIAAIERLVVNRVP
ncbi:unnamed protein product [Hermetia illucens]|uniref:Ubiquitin-like protease family profile domain-containing protein n=1 Tax=Hermetia illucens TaxID=343691 RepID=A0A7R8YS12_HERIL|nr:unnamed protein product [Hermetia illucens]